MLRGYDIKIDDDEIDENTPDWTEEAFGFIADVFLGIERQVFKEGEKTSPLKGKVNDREGMLIGSRIIEFYLTQVYKQLADKDDPFIVEKFVKIGEACDEKPLFMLNLISNTIQKVYPMMQRSKFDVSDEQKYVDSVRMNVMVMKKYVTQELKDVLRKLKEAKKVKRVDDD